MPAKPRAASIKLLGSDGGPPGRPTASMSCAGSPDRMVRSNCTASRSPRSASPSCWPIRTKANSTPTRAGRPTEKALSLSAIDERTTRADSVWGGEVETLSAGDSRWPAASAALANRNCSETADRKQSQHQRTRLGSERNTERRVTEVDGHEYLGIIGEHFAERDRAVASFFLIHADRPNGAGAEARKINNQRRQQPSAAATVGLHGNISAWCGQSHAPQDIVLVIVARTNEHTRAG